MKKNNQAKGEQLENPYKKTFDDANKLLKEIGGVDDVEFLISITDDHKNKHASIPFPYGNNERRPYNFN